MKFPRTAPRNYTSDEGYRLHKDQYGPAARYWTLWDHTGFCVGKERTLAEAKELAEEWFAEFGGRRS